MSTWQRELDNFLDRVKSVTPFRKKVREQAELARQYNAQQPDAAEISDSAQSQRLPVREKRVPDTNG